MNAIISSSGRKTASAEPRVPPFVGILKRAEGGSEIVVLTKAALIGMIRAAWEAVGESVEVWIDADGEIRSDLVNGLPARGKLLQFKPGRGGW